MQASFVTTHQPLSILHDGALKADDLKRKRDLGSTVEYILDVSESGSFKKAKVDDGDDCASSARSVESSTTNIPAAKEGIAFFGDNDVLCGRGGGTNVHPGNRTFRDLVNLHRRAYLKARKNDKPAISRTIVKAIRDANGRFLKKDEDSGLWFEIGDDGAREKTSQALRQRAPEMRKILFDSERQVLASQEHHQPQSPAHLPAAIFCLGGLTAAASAPAGIVNNNGLSNTNSVVNPMLNPALLAIANKNALMGLSSFRTAAPDPYTQMVSAALLGGRINRLAPHGA